MSYNSNTIYTTSTYGISIGDIKSFFGSSRNDIGALITNVEINKWAKYKPVRHPSYKPLTESQRAKVSFGIGGGGGDYGKNAKDGFGGGAGAGVKIDPVAFLIIKDGVTRMMPVAASPKSTMDRIVDMAPELMDKVEKYLDKKGEKETV